MTRPASRDVLVVGAGPVGLVLACELARRGVGVRVVDALPQPTDQSRAVLVHARTLELLAGLGVADEVVASGVRTTHLRLLEGAQVLADLRLDTVDSPYRFSVTTAQTETERVLTARLHALGGAVERGLTLTGLSQDDAAVRATLRDANGREQTALVAYVVGCDGSRSAVRAATGQRLVGTFTGERFLLGDVEADHDLPSDAMLSYLARQGPLLVFPMRGHRVRLIAQVADDAPLGQGTLAELQAVSDERGAPLRLLSSHWTTTFEVHHAQVPHYRSGRVFLAGDAAHVHSPAGGQGMNTGMQDAFDLGWKLARAADSSDRETLLDSYHAERAPVAARVLRDTTRMTDLAAVRNPLLQQLRNRVVHLATALAPVQHALAAQLEETDIAYTGSPVVTGSGTGPLRAGQRAPRLPHPALVGRLDHVGLLFPGPAAPRTPVPEGRTTWAVVGGDARSGEVAVPDDGQLAQAYGLPRGGVALVRPDGYVGLLATGGDALAACERYLRVAGP